MVLPLIYTRWNLTPINFLVRHIAVQLMRSAAIRSVNCAGMPTGLTTSSAAPVSDLLRMRQAIVRPLTSMIPIFMKRPVVAQYRRPNWEICATCNHARPV